MDPKYQCVKLNDGHFIPVLGFGTYAPPEDPKNKTLEATKVAIEAGFRHIDSAYFYNNEEEVGLAIRSKIAEGIVKREDIFYTTKLWCTFHRPELVRPGLETSLKRLQLDYVDLYLIHFPMSLKPGQKFYPGNEQGNVLPDTVDLRATWEAMEKCKDAGLAKSIGVSNFNCRQLEMILNKPGLRYKPVCNQVECHPYLNQSKLLDFCKSKDIVLVAYCALGSQRENQCVDPSSLVLLSDPVLCAMAEKYKRTPALIALRYQLQRGVVVLAKSFNEKHIRENLQVFEFQLSSEDMKVLDGLNRNIRYIDAKLFFLTTLIIHFLMNIDMEALAWLLPDPLHVDSDAADISDAGDWTPHFCLKPSCLAAHAQPQLSLHIRKERH
ncbi:PREDICTED: aldo-keto reductase family 1 member C1-like isoform X1 [Galeopterus variegatus]|uniref:Aldo-keto reductase family 1 member C1-like isoform X1 n=1 Tax=Galeopterus variegatus TaxID=482537 RepID=A0ABM0PZL3_GALVR|nr:PREDICTED: aldo-keto reductase family 1 member C1-like isoform X1 [Galeopterus variegatus]